MAYGISHTVGRPLILANPLRIRIAPDLLHRARAAAGMTDQTLAELIRQAILTEVERTERVTGAILHKKGSAK
jgi:hypothetical protein